MSALKRRISVKVTVCYKTLTHNWNYFLSKGVYHKILRNMHILLCSAVGLSGCWGLSQPSTFFLPQRSWKALWRKSWFASKHLARLKGMRDSLLWKLGWAPETVQNTLLGSTGKYSVLYHWASVSIWKQLTIFCSFNGKLQCIPQSCSQLADSVTLGNIWWTNSIGAL